MFRIAIEKNTQNLLRTAHAPIHSERSKKAKKKKTHQPVAKTQVKHRPALSAASKNFRILTEKNKRENDARFVLET